MMRTGRCSHNTENSIFHFVCEFSRFSDKTHTFFHPTRSGTKCKRNPTGSRSFFSHSTISLLQSITCCYNRWRILMERDWLLMKSNEFDKDDSMISISPFSLGWRSRFQYWKHIFQLEEFHSTLVICSEY